VSGKELVPVVHYTISAYNEPRKVSDSVLLFLRKLVFAELHTTRIDYLRKRRRIEHEIDNLIAALVSFHLSFRTGGVFYRRF
jgi:hypothetical protein